MGDIPGAEVPVVELPEPDYRISGKQPPPRLCALKGSGEVGDQRTKVISGWTMRTLIQQQEEKAMNYYHAGMFNLDDCAEVLRDVHLGTKAKRKTRGVNTSALILGAYVHGGVRGVTTATLKRPWLTKCLNMVLRLRTLGTTKQGNRHGLRWVFSGRMRSLLIVIFATSRAWQTSYGSGNQ